MGCEIKHIRFGQSILNHDMSGLAQDRMRTEDSSLVETAESSDLKSSRDDIVITQTSEVTALRWLSCFRQLT